MGRKKKQEAEESEEKPDLMCTACGSKEPHHLKFVIEQGLCLV